MAHETNFRHGTNYRKNLTHYSLFHVYRNFPENYLGHAIIAFLDPSPRLSVMDAEGFFMGNATLNNGTLEAVCKEAYEKYLKIMSDAKKLTDDFFKEEGNA